jgi:hypothetical protein
VDNVRAREGEGDKIGGGGEVQDRGERSRSSSPSAPRNSSTSLRRLRILLGGGVIASGEGGVGTSPPAVAAIAEAATSRGVLSVLAPTVVAAGLRRRRQRRRRRRLAPVVANDAGRLHVTVMTCVPAAWLKTTRAFRPLARHRSCNAEKSAMEIAGCDMEQAGSSTLPLTTLAHVAVGETREVGGREESLDSWHPACLARSPATPEEGAAERRGAWRADRTAGLLRPPTPLGGGGGQQEAGRGSERRRGEPSSTKVSSGLMPRLAAD